MPLKTLQGLLVGSALIWAIFPFYGAPVYLAFELLLILTALSKSRSALKYVQSAGGHLEKTLSPEARGWVEKYAFHFVWPEEAKAYGTTLKMTSLMMMLLAVAWVGHTIFRFNLSILLMFLPGLAVFAAGVSLGGKLEPDQLLSEDRYKDQRPLHEEAVKVLALLSTAGRWTPPAPP